MMFNIFKCQYPSKINYDTPYLYEKMHIFQLNLTGIGHFSTRISAFYMGLVIHFDPLITNGLAHRYNLGESTLI